jgi:hypothetical protein
MPSRVGKPCVASSPRFGCYSQLPTGAYWGLLGPIVISVSIWLPISSVLSACYCLDRRHVLKLLVTSEYDRIISSASTTNYMYTCLLRATLDIACSEPLHQIKMRISNV